MKKVFDFGKVDWNGTGRKTNAVTIEVELRDTDKGPEFSACGNVWNARHTDVVCAGQCLDSIHEFTALKFNPLFKKIYNLWNSYHLNGCMAGTERQTKAINEYLESNNLRYDYDLVCEYLKSIDLYCDKEYLFRYGNEVQPYRYGSAWLHHDIPEEDLEVIRELLK